VERLAKNKIATTVNICFFMVLRFVIKLSIEIDDVKLSS
jgi:hypothetical protein